MARTFHPVDAVAIAREYRARRAAGRMHKGGPEPMVQYQLDPIGFCVDILGDRREMFVWSDAGPEYATHEWDGTVNPLADIFEGLAAGQSTVCMSGTGIGKSALAARACLWFLASFKYARVPTYAPRKDQLTDYMWAEMGKLWPKFSKHFPSAVLQDLALYMDGTAKDRELWSAVGVPVQQKAGEQISTRAAGIHAEHMMLVLEEVEGIATPTIEALENTCTAPHNFFFAPGNPNSKHGTLFKLSKRPSWRSVRASALDHPNVVCRNAQIVPGAVSVESIVMRAEKYDVAIIDGVYQVRDPLADPMFRSRVSGIAPEQAAEALIRMEWVDAAIAHARRVTPHLSDLRLAGALGADPSNSYRGDPAGVARFVGPIVVSVTERPCPDSNDFGDDIFQFAQHYEIGAAHVGIDPVGVGAGTANQFNRRLGDMGTVPRLDMLATHVVKPSEGPQWDYDMTTFSTARAQQHWQLKMDLQWSAKRTVAAGALLDAGAITFEEYWAQTRACIGLPNNARMAEDLTSVKVQPTNNGKVSLMPKDDIRDELGRSPNAGDAVVYGNWVRPRDRAPEQRDGNPGDQSLGHAALSKGRRHLDETDRDTAPAPAVRVTPFWKPLR